MEMKFTFYSYVMRKAVKVQKVWNEDIFSMEIKFTFYSFIGAPVTQWVKRWPIDLADRVRSPLEAKSSQPQTEFHCTKPFIINFPSS